jgi:hypothetical protein
MQIHGSWNFFPWHRAYLYFHERILGSLIGNINNFRLPYWDWENSRTMPSLYLSPGSSANSPWDGNRDSGIAAGGALPSTDGTTARITTLLGITDFATFGGTATDAGACENDPHNIIHSDVGPPSPPYEDMGNLGYAGRDPIFFGHHCNIDKLWSRWNSQTGTGTSYQNPTAPGFLHASWSFYDENQKVVSISAADVLDYKNNLRYTYQRPRITLTIPLYEILNCELVCCVPGPDPGPFLKVSQDVSQLVLTQIRENVPVVLVLAGVEVPEGVTGAFDVVSLKGDRRTQIGTLTVLADSMRSKMHKSVTLVLDISKAAPDLLASEKPASIHLIARHAADKAAKPFVLRARSAQIRVGKRGNNPQN